MKLNDNVYNNWCRFGKTMINGYYQIISGTYPRDTSCHKDKLKEEQAKDYAEIRSAFLKGNGKVWFVLAERIDLYGFFENWFKENETLADSLKSWKIRELQQQIYEDHKKLVKQKGKNVK